MYLLYLYSKWQSIDLYESVFKDLLVDNFIKSRTNQVLAVGMLALYLSILGITVRFLRKDYRINRANVQDLEPPLIVEDHPHQD